MCVCVCVSVCVYVIVYINHTMNLDILAQYSYVYI